MFCMFSHVICTPCILPQFLVCVCGGQHYGLEIDIHCNILSSGSLILHCCVVFHLEPVSHLPTGGHWDRVQSFPMTSAGLRRACESSGRPVADRLSPGCWMKAFRPCHSRWPETLPSSAKTNGPGASETGSGAPDAV